MLLSNVKVNGRPDAPAAEAVLVEHGRIAAVGPAADVEAQAPPATPQVDGGGRRVVPGLIDGHAHVLRAGLTWDLEVRWDEAASLDEALGLLQRRAADTAPGAWIPVIGSWHPAQFAEGRGPTRADLDRVLPDNPCYVQLLYDEAVLNTAGLAACDLTADGDDPAGGRLDRDEQGELTGVVRGPGAFQHCVRRLAARSFEEQVASTRAMTRDLAAYGLTGALDPGGIGVGPETYQPLYEVWRRGELGTRVRLYLGAGTRGTEREQVEDWLRFMPRGFGDDRLRITGIGEIVVFACWDSDGLKPFEVDDDSLETFTDLSRKAAAGGWPMHVHAVSDVAVGMVLDAWEQVDKEHPLAGLRFAIAHAELVGERNLLRARDLGVGFAIQDRLIFRAAQTAARWGEDALAAAPPLQRMLELDLPLSGGTDSTVVSPINPWLSLWWFVTGRSRDDGPRRAPAHRLDRAQGLRLYTQGSAWHAFDEARLGRLAPGYLADLALLTEDYFGVDADAIPAIRSDLTLVGGEVVHAAEPFAGVRETVAGGEPHP